MAHVISGPLISDSRPYMQCCSFRDPEKKLQLQGHAGIIKATVFLLGETCDQATINKQSGKCNRLTYFYV